VFAEREDDELVIIRSARVMIDPLRFLVVANEREVSLYPKEFEVLYYLAKHSGWVLPAEKIYYAVWHECVYGYEYIIYNTISQIRKKLNMPDIIQTIKNRGYKYLG